MYFRCIRLCLVVSLLAFAAIPGRTAPKSEYGKIELLCRFIDTVLANAWRELEGTKDQRAGSNIRTRSQTLGWFDSLDGFGSLDPAGDLAVPAITCLDGQTLHSQAAQSYTQFVPLHDVDSAQSICPIGHIDRPDSPFRNSTLPLWGEAGLHPAPLSRAAVEKIAEERLLIAK